MIDALPAPRTAGVILGGIPRFRAHGVLILRKFCLGAPFLSPILTHMLPLFAFASRLKEKVHLRISKDQVRCSGFLFLAAKWDPEGYKV